MTIGSITPYLKHTVSIVKVAMAAGVRTVTQVDNVPAFVFEDRGLRRNREGDLEHATTCVYLEPDQDVVEVDEILFNGRQRPIRRLTPTRDDVAVKFIRLELS